MPNALSPSGGSIALTLPTSSSRTTRTTSPTTTAATGASVKRASPNSPSLPLAPASSSGGGGAGPAPLGTTSLLANKSPPALPARSQAWHDAGSSQQQQQPSGMTAASSAPAATSPPQLQVPGYAQRDELASQIWAAAREGGNAEWLTLLGLARLASQHHLSPYNCLKHGAKGSPYAYLPITLQQPQLVAETMDKQRFNEARAAEWLQRKRCRAVEAREREEARIATQAQAAAKQEANVDDEDQIMTSASCGVKRPLSALSQGSADALEPRQVARAMAVDEPPNSSSGGAGDGMEHALRDAMSSSLRTSALPDAANAGSSIEMTGPLGVEVMQTQEKEQTVMQPHAANVAPQQINAATTVAQLPAAAQHALAMKTSDTHPINISPIVPPELLSSVSSQIYAVLPACVQDCHTHRPTQITDASSMLSARPAVPTPSADAPDVHAARQVAGERLIRLAASVDLVQMAADEEAAQRAAHFQMLQQNAPPGSVVLRPDAQTPVAMVTACNVAALPAASTNGNGEGTTASATQGLMMGNLLLSSCPGKKVRLTGPVRGRGAICRDLGLDLRRIRGIGVGAVICCLDDEELAFLGAPWEEYEREADALGMDVVRLPMAEGFAPTCVRTTDAAMTSIVSDYTLRGIHVLVHCRGGVGRAGLIACTWMCKLGLVRSAEVEQSTPALAAAAAAASAGNAQPQTTQANAEPRGCEDTQVYSTVERLVNTIRRRRSPKAIETAEQVKFIVDYVTYLHQQEQLHKANAQN